MKAKAWQSIVALLLSSRGCSHLSYRITQACYIDIYIHTHTYGGIIQIWHSLGRFLIIVGKFCIILYTILLTCSCKLFRNLKLCSSRQLKPIQMLPVITVIWVRAFLNSYLLYCLFASYSLCLKRKSNLLSLLLARQISILLPRKTASQKNRALNQKSCHTIWQIKRAAQSSPEVAALQCLQIGSFMLCL